MVPFIPNRSLLNPKFDGYRFDPINQEDTVIRYDLDHRPTQVANSSKAPLSFHEVQSRITHNHLAVAPDSGRAVYIDAEYKVLMVDVDSTTLVPVFRVIYELPRPVQSPAVDTPHREYPSAAFLSNYCVFVCDGLGALYVLQFEDDGPTVICGVYGLASDSLYGSAPFRVHNVMKVSSYQAVAVLSLRRHEDKALASGGSSRQKAPTPVEYGIWAAQFTLPFDGEVRETRNMDILWRLQGLDVPIHVIYDPSRSAHLLIASSRYHHLGVETISPYEPNDDEIVPIPHGGEDLDNEEQVPRKSPPYSWTQTSDSVTVAFPIPSSTPTSSIKVVFSPRTLSVHVDDETSTALPLPHYSMAELWDNISPSTSMWTLDREAEHSFGILTIHLDKAHEGTKWMHVFSAVDVEVSETLDPSELWNIRESLEKYTSDSKEGGGLGLGRGVPSLAEGERDDDVDDDIGRTAYLTWVHSDGSNTVSSDKQSNGPFRLLSTPLPGFDSDNTLIVKNTIDGAVYSLRPSSFDDGSPIWTHTSTFSALAFVLASKRDTRFTYHISSTAVLAFESGVGNIGGNVYLYRGHRPGDKWAKQAVLKVGDGASGPLLGVGALYSTKGQPVLLALTEGQLVLIHSVL